MLVLVFFLIYGILAEVQMLGLENTLWSKPLGNISCSAGLSASTFNVSIFFNLIYLGGPLSIFLPGLIWLVECMVSNLSYLTYFSYIILIDFSDFISSHSNSIISCYSYSISAGLKFIKLSF